MRALASVAFVLMAVVVSCGKDDRVGPQPPIAGDDIVFASTREGGILDLYVMNADGSGLHRLTADTLEDREPRWSPDGSKIVFIHRYDRNGDSSCVTVMNADGTNRIRLTRNYADTNPSWSPDGSRIAYQPGLMDQLWVMNADGTSPQLVIDSDSLNGVIGVSWTSQNTFLGSDGDGFVEFNVDGTGRNRIITLFNLGFTYSRMSPDGSRVAFTWSGPSGGGTHIYSVNVDGTDLKQLTTTAGATRPVWSPDGARIAFIGHDFGVWTMNADGTNQVPVPLANSSFRDDYLGDWR